MGRNPAFPPTWNSGGFHSGPGQNQTSLILVRQSYIVASYDHTLGPNESTSVLWMKSLV